MGVAGGSSQPVGVRLRVACAAAGALIGVLIVWLERPSAEPCTVLADGTRACMPLLVVPAPWWAYVVVGVVGAVVATLLAQWGLALVRRLRRHPGEDASRTAEASGRMAG